MRIDAPVLLVAATQKVIRRDVLVCWEPDGLQRDPIRFEQIKQTAQIVH